jgi:hypothetical protein
MTAQVVIGKPGAEEALEQGALLGPLPVCSSDLHTPAWSRRRPIVGAGTRVMALIVLGRRAQTSDRKGVRVSVWNGQVALVTGSSRGIGNAQQCSGDGLVSTDLLNLWSVSGVRQLVLPRVLETVR